MDKTTAIATASASTDTAAPHHAPNTPLEGERSGRELTGDVGARTEVGEGKDGGEKRPPDESSKHMEPASPPDEAKATRDQGNQPTTSVSTRSAPRDHSDEDASMRNPPQPSEDPGDATGNDERRPDAPTELPDKPEGRRGRRGKTRVFEASRERMGSTGDDSVEMCRPEKPDKPNHEVEGARVDEVEMRWSKALRGVEESPDEDGSDECRPGMPDEAPDEPSHETLDPSTVQVEPGGETAVEQDRSAARTDADAMIDDRAEEAHDAVQDEAERSATCPNMSIEGERGSALAQGQSTTTDKPDNQRSETSVDNIPRAPPEPPPPVHTPDKPTHCTNEPPSIELEGERCTSASCDVGPTSAETDAREKLTNLPDALGRERERSKRRTRENSPRRAQEELEDLGCEVDVLVMSEGDEDPQNQPKAAQDVSERISK